MDAVQAAFTKHGFDHFHGVVAHHADVGDLVFGDEFEQVADARAVDVDGEKVFFRQTAGDFGGGGAHAEADFQDFRIITAESGVQIDGGSLKIQAELRPVVVDGALLGGGHMALAQDEGFDAAPLSAVGGVVGLLGDVGHGVVFRSLGFQAAWGGLKQAA